ncbi:MAG: YesL family protein [Eubacteriales bacterium]|jgi:uncharacterized membrane protein YesL
MFQYDSPVMALLRGILNYVQLSLLWILFSLPILTIGASTSALYYATKNVLLEEKGYLFSTFWKGFRKNFKQSTILWVCLAVAGILIWQDIRIMRAISDAAWSIALQYVQYLIALLLTIIFLYGMPHIARFNNSLRQIVRNSILLGIRHLFNTVFILLLIAAGAISVWLLNVLLIIMPALIMAFWCKRLEKVFSKYMQL